MPDLIRHPELFVFTGFRPFDEFTVLSLSKDFRRNDVFQLFSTFYETINIVKRRNNHYYKVNVKESEVRS